MKKEIIHITTVQEKYVKSIKHAREEFKFY